MSNDNHAPLEIQFRMPATKDILKSVIINSVASVALGVATLGILAGAITIIEKRNARRKARSTK